MTITTFGTLCMVVVSSVMDSRILLLFYDVKRFNVIPYHVNHRLLECISFELPKKSIIYRLQIEISGYSIHSCIHSNYWELRHNQVHIPAPLNENAETEHCTSQIISSVQKR